MSAIAAKTSFTDLFIRRPVLAIVINLIILAVGWRAISSLPVRQYPRIESSSIIITTAYIGGRPKIQVNSWTSASPGASSQPDSRSLTIGTYRGNNTTYTYSVPASAFVAGVNTLTITIISGSSGTGFLSPGCGIDCVDLY